MFRKIIPLSSDDFRNLLDGFDVYEAYRGEECAYLSERFFDLKHLCENFKVKYEKLKLGGK